MAALKSEADKLESLLTDSPFKDSPGHHRFAEAVTENQAPGDMAQMEQALADVQKSRRSATVSRPRPNCMVWSANFNN